MKLSNQVWRRQVYLAQHVSSQEDDLIAVRTLGREKATSQLIH